MLLRDNYREPRKVTHVSPDDPEEGNAGEKEKTEISLIFLVWQIVGLGCGGVTEPMRLQFLGAASLLGTWGDFLLYCEEHQECSHWRLLLCGLWVLQWLYVHGWGSPVDYFRSKVISPKGWYVFSGQEHF